ncbi:FAD-dependent monooxygenase [Crossiella sp. CA-258035]|uniref:FAD-dependent monooxygenase n=1 Tax=Crossiella sp. CA-258035 TaxID=2981138 RepID=UPI0032DA4D87
MDSTEVLVVGAGPTGLTLACGLRAHGVSVRVLDGAQGPAATSRANILHARGVEVLDRLGALGDLPQQSVTALRITVKLGERTISQVRFGDVGLGTARPALLASQATIEARLRDRLAELGGQVEWDTPVTAVTQDADGATATLGDGQAVRAGWVVGCDGAHSTVRKVAGIGFPGAPVADSWLLADVHIDWPGSDRAGTVVWLHRDGVIGALPMREVGGAEDLWRLMTYLPGAAPGQLGEAEILDRFRELLPHRTGMTGIRIRDAAWASVFRIHRRLAETYRSGRILLAGDAAHIHSPLGGQGMLTGIGDAENLAWKLALVASGRAEQALLETYQAERRPLATEVLKRTTANTRLQTSDHALVRFLRERIMSPVVNLPPVQRWATALAAQLWVSYRRGPLAGPGNRFGARPRPGDRVPDLSCRRAGNATRLHAELGDHWAVLGSGTAAAAPAAAARHLLGDRVHDLVCAEVPAGQVWLVRPDAHLAWRGDPGSGGLRRWLDTALRHGRAG